MVFAPFASAQCRLNVRNAGFLRGEFEPAFAEELLHQRFDLLFQEGCGSFTATPQTPVFQSPIVPCLVISLFLQKAVAMVAEPWASLRIWPGDCVDTPVVRGNPSTR